MSDTVEPVKDFPFNPDDVWSLEKGDLIPVEACERASGTSRTDASYRLELLALREKLERLWFDLRGERITTKTEHDGIRVYSDEDAVIVNDRTLDSTRKRVGRVVKQVCGIDASKICSPTARERLVRLSVRAAALYSGGRQSVRAALKAYRRNTPAQLPEAK